MPTNDRPTLSVILPSYGRQDALCNTLADLFVQTHSPIEILVIHQCPDPKHGGTQTLRQWAKDGKIRLFEPTFANAERARNLAIQEARGEILLFLDDDLKLGPELVERHLHNYVEDPSLDGVAGQVLAPNQSPTTELGSHCRWPHVGWYCFPLNYAVRTEAKNCPGGNTSIRRKTATAVGGFDEQFERTVFDDTDFSRRLSQHSCRMVFDPTASVIHLRVPLGGKRIEGQPSLWMDHFGWMTHLYFWRKHYGLWKARHAFFWMVRHLIFRKAVLVRPHWFLSNLLHFWRGYREASRKLEEGPRYLQPFQQTFEVRG